MTLVQLIKIGDWHYEQLSPVSQIIFVKEMGHYIVVLENSYSFKAVTGQFVPINIRKVDLKVKADSNEQ